MADQRTMDQFLQAPTECYEDTIVVPAITPDNFELKHGLLTLVQNKQFFGHDKEDPHAHGAARIWLEKEPPRSIFTWDDLVSKFINQFFPSPKQLIFRMKSPIFNNVLMNLLVKHGIDSKIFLEPVLIMECLAIIESNSKVHYSRNKPVVVKVSTNTSTSGVSPDVAELKDMVKALLLDKKSQNQSPARVKAVKESCVTCGGAQSYLNPTNNESTEDVQPQVVQSESPILNSKLVTSPISEPVISPIFKDMSFKISFADALILMPKFASTLKALIGNKEKLSEMARTLLNEHCSTILVKKLPKKLGDPGKFLIPSDRSISRPVEVAEDVYAKVELADRSISRPVEVSEDVYVKVGSFHFSTDFIVVDFDAGPRVPLILRRSFLKTRRALIDVFEGELTLRVGKEAITFNLDQTLRYSANYSDMTAKGIIVIDMACEEYSQEVLGFSDVISSGNPTPYYDPIVSTTSLTLTLFENSDFLLEEVDAFLATKDDPTSLEFYQPYLDPEGDILLLKAFLNDDPSLPPPNQGNYLSEVEHKDLPPHLEYAFLEGDDKLPVIIAKDLSMEEKTALITVLKSHNRAIAWKLSDIKGIDPEFRTHKILMQEDFEPAVQHQRRVKPKIHDVIKQEVLKLLDARLIYPISDSPWVSPVHCVPKKGGFTVAENEDNELILTRLVTGWRVCIDYYKLNEATQCVEAFQTLKRKLTKAPILIAPDWDMLFELMYDASDFAIGAVLGQRQDKHFRPIHYTSKTMTKAKSNYITTKNEMLAVVYVFEKFRSYLIMNKSIVYTDHSSLKYLFAKKDSKVDCFNGFYSSRNSPSK
nr:reverse transcriptase domain-containing protein [Tanacetum cinerariifolium]